MKMKSRVGRILNLGAAPFELTLFVDGDRSSARALGDADVDAPRGAPGPAPRGGHVDGSYDVRAHVFSKRRSEKVALESRDASGPRRVAPFGAGLERRCNDLLMGGRPFCSGAQGGAFAVSGARARRSRGTGSTATSRTTRSSRGAPRAAVDASWGGDQAPLAELMGARCGGARAGRRFAEERLLRREALRRVGVVRSGYLRRATRRKQATVWRFHRVELARGAGGVVTFCWSGVGDGGVRGDRSGERRVALRRGEASCAAALGGAARGPGDDDAVFVLGAGDDRVAWMAASMGERDAWVEAVAACLEEGGDASRPPSKAAAAARRGGEARDGAAGDGRRARGDPPPAEALRQRVVQMRKDMRRDRVSIDGEVVAADGRRRRARRRRSTTKRAAPRRAAAPRGGAARRRPGGANAASPRPLAALSEAGAVTHAAAVWSRARDVLGRRARACVHALCKPLGALIVLCPLSTHASPLELRVSFSRRARALGRARRRRPSARLAAPGAPRQPGVAEPVLRAEAPGDADDVARAAVARRRLGRVAARRRGGFAADGSHSPSDAAWASTTDVPRDESGAATSDDDDGDGRDDDASPAGAGAGAAPRARAGAAGRRPPVPRRRRRPRDDGLPRLHGEPAGRAPDTWALVRAVWTQSFAVTGDPAKGATNFKASEPQVHIGISDFTLWDPTEER
ncbi:hypothetical protein SO694_0003628 [Aureococcus anophagefferens]|uniref:PH domain-containing protein n=1 Tax=Aureococcus anophagefferens TaxID=44056 RepID=A0ABR1FLA5_AURAN